MDVETQSQISDLEIERHAHRDRLQVLKIQAARSGRSTPAEVVTEIAEIAAKLVPIDAAIFKLTYVGLVRADVPDNGVSGDERRGATIGMAVERTMERNRRAMVASQTDQLMYLDIRLDSALREVRAALVAVAVLGALALMMAIGALIYMIAQQP